MERENHIAIAEETKSPALEIERGFSHLGEVWVSLNFRIFVEYKAEVS